MSFLIAGWLISSFRALCCRVSFHFDNPIVLFMFNFMFDMVNIWLALLVNSRKARNMESAMTLSLVVLPCHGVMRELKKLLEELIHRHSSF